MAPPPLKLVMKLRCITVSAVSGERPYNGNEVELFGGFARTGNVTATLQDETVTKRKNENYAIYIYICVCVCVCVYRILYIRIPYRSVYFIRAFYAA